MTRAASGAQRSGAAALIMTIAHPRVILCMPHQYCVSSFFVAPTPVRWLRRIRWAGPGSSGSPVLIGSGGRTGKRLKSNGSTVLFRKPSRDARTGTAARTYARKPQNHRTIELPLKTKVYPEVTGSVSVLWFWNAAATGTRLMGKAWDHNGFPVLRSIIIGGGYSPAAFADATSRYQGLDRRAAAPKFRSRARLAAAIGAGDWSASEARGNGGFLPFFEGSDGHVGMATLERGPKIEAYQPFARPLRQPARLAAAALATPRGVRSGRPGGTPPSDRATSSSSWAQPIFQVSIDLPIRGATGLRLDRQGCLISNREKGSGERRLPGCQLTPGANALNEPGQRWVGGMGAFLGVGRTREWSTLWGGSASVN